MYEIPTLVADLLDRLKVNLSIHEVYWNTKMAAELMVEELMIEDDHMNEDASIACSTRTDVCWMEMRG